MADNVNITPGSGNIVAADEVVDATLGTVKVQYTKLMDGTIDGTNKLSVSAAGAAKVDGSAVTQPISGTITANAGTNLNTSALALDATLTGGAQQTKIVQGGNTAVVDATGDLQVDVNNFPASQVVSQATGTNLHTVIDSGTVTLSGTSPVSGTVTANQGTPNTTANKWPIAIVDSGGVNVATVNTTNELLVTDTDLTLAQASATSGQLGPLVQGAVTTAAPTYVTGNTNPLSITTAGALRTDASATTQPVSGTVTANAGTGNFSENLAQVNGSTVSTAATGVQKVGIVGNTGATVDAAGQNVASPANSILVAGQFNTTPTAISTGNMSPLQMNAQGALIVQNTASTKAVFAACAATTTPAATTTDFMTIYGSATKTIRIFKIEIAYTATALADLKVFIVKRSATNTGGTSSAPTIPAFDSNNTPTATVLVYTANPTALGATVGTVSAADILVGGTTTVTAAQLMYTFDFTDSGVGSGVVLRGTSQGLAVNMNGAAVPTGGSIPVCNITWIEE